LHTKRKKGERVRGTPPTTSFFTVHQWRDGKGATGGGACARAERVQGVHRCRKEVRKARACLYRLGRRGKAIAGAN
jgi:hypothetical protein